MKRRLFGVLIVMCVPLLAVIQVSAQTPVPVTANDVNRVAATLYCPVCQNVPLAVCETQACEQWREEIRGLLGQGYTDEQIRQRFVQEYGQKTVGLPTNGTTFALTVYLPYALVAAIGVLLTLMLVVWQRRQKSAPELSPETPPASDPYYQRLEDEIKRLD
jgi:cytochrome c-type biogenesis protein CcmH